MKVKLLTKCINDACHKLCYLSFIVLFSFGGGYSNAQSLVTGTIISSEDGLGLPGVTIIKKGTTDGTSTDLNGKYSISAKAEDLLIFSFVGYKSVERSVGISSIINIELEMDIEDLAEIIVMGYTEKSQKEISASVVSIGFDEMESVTSSNVETMLQGKVAGLTVNSATGQPGTPAEIRLRGITSINADRSPLIVVDGMIGGNYVPSDVETITVLKDAAAIGLYGSLGAAGVIIITTKVATSDKPEFSLGMSYGLKDAITGNFEMQNGQEIYDTQKKMWGDDELGFLANRPQELRDQNFDWIDAGFRQAVIQNYNFSARGKSNKMTYNFNVDYFNEEGTFINTDYERLNLRAGGKYDATDWFSINSVVNVQFSNDNTNHYSWFEDAFYSMPWDNPYNEDGSTKFVAAGGVGDWYGQFGRNFLNSTKYNFLKSSGTDIIWTTRFLFTINDWFSIETRTRLNSFNGRSDEYYSASTHEGIQDNGIVYASQLSERGILSTHFLRFNKAVGDHDFSGFVAHEGSYSFQQTLETEVKNLAPSITVPAGGSVYSYVGGFDQTFKSISFIGEASYGYQGKYFASAVYRLDGSSVFAPDTRYGSFPSASVSWLMSEENFMAKSSLIDMFKVRFSYGLVGNDGRGSESGPQAYAYLPTYDITRQYNGQPGGDPDNPANSSLGWETSTIANLGVDISLLKGDLTFNIDAYQKKVDGMLFKNPLAFSQGYQFRWENIGAMKNKGVEFSVSYGKSWGDWSYKGNFNFAYNANKMTYISDITDEAYLYSGPVGQINKVGLEAFTWYMPKWLGVDPTNGAPIWEKIETDGSVSQTSVYNDATIQPIESALPTLTGGMTNSLSFKDFTFSFLLTFQTGNHIYHSSREFLDSDGADLGINQMRMQDEWVRWENPGDIATHPILTLGDFDQSHQTSSRYMEKGDFLRVRNITLTYNLPRLILDWAKIKNASLSASADNLFTFTEFSGMDPDINMSVNSFELPGLSFLKYPISKQYIIRLNIYF